MEILKFIIQRLAYLLMNFQNSSFKLLDIVREFQRIFLRLTELLRVRPVV
ncbi:MAG: hypothetical protein ACXVHR_11090 [Methanobacterium sp.]